MTFSIIRPLRAGDLDRVGHLVEANDLFPADMLSGMTAPFLAGDTTTHRWLVLERAGVDGVAYYVPEQLTEGTWNLLLIAVDPSAHGQGAGTALVRAVESDLADSGQRLLLVETSGTDRFAATRAFYEKRGFTFEARIRDYYAAGDDKTIYRKALG